MYIKRNLEDKLRKYLPSREILAVVGPRQSGKTTLLRQLFSGLPKAVFLDFEDRELVRLFTEDIKAFAELYAKQNKYIFIDEFQYAKEGGKQLKFLYDHYPVKVCISGSSASELSIQGIRYLVGRVFVFNLYPLSFEEFLSFKNGPLYSLLVKQPSLSPVIIEKILPYWQEFCVYGGYPRVVLATDPQEKEEVLRNIFNIYLLKEIREIFNLPDEGFSKLLHALAFQAGNLVNYQELSLLTGLPYKEVIRNFSVLEKTFIMQRSRPFSRNKRVEVVKTPKLFFVDNGFRNSIIKNFQPLRERPDKGLLIENFVASELLKEGEELHFWRSKSKAEVDFVVEKKGKILPLEVKSDLLQPKPGKSLFSFLSIYNPEKALVLSSTFWMKKGKIIYRPAFMVKKLLGRR